jgi:eukaryotic-like serine/threonine-protein kinase
MIPVTQITNHTDGPTADERLLLRRALAGKYDVVRLIGRGGMGSVYLARDLRLGRPVAIKVLKPELSESEEQRERFRREARITARLDHPNIVPLYEHGETADGILYFVMGYVQGESLAARVQRLGRLWPNETRRLLGELADALDYSHRQGVVHCDLKLANVLIDGATGRAVLADFGLAQVVDKRPDVEVAIPTSAEGLAFGTPHYMAPEQAAGEQHLDARTDLYALGIVAYEMLSGRPPFDGRSFREIAAQHATQEPPPLADRAPQASPEVVEVIARCLAKDPAERWPSGGAFRAALEATFEERPLKRRFQDVRRSVTRIVGSIAVGLGAVVVGWAMK